MKREYEWRRLRTGAIYAEPMLFEDANEAYLYAHAEAGVISKEHTCSQECDHIALYVTNTGERIQGMIIEPGKHAYLNDLPELRRTKWTKKLK